MRIFDPKSFQGPRLVGVFASLWLLLAGSLFGKVQVASNEFREAKTEVSAKNVAPKLISGPDRGELKDLAKIRFSDVPFDIIRIRPSGETAALIREFKVHLQPPRANTSPGKADLEVKLNSDDEVFVAFPKGDFKIRFEALDPYTQLKFASEKESISNWHAVDKLGSKVEYSAQPKQANLRLEAWLSDRSIELRYTLEPMELSQLYGSIVSGLEKPSETPLSAKYQGSLKDERGVRYATPNKSLPAGVWNVTAHVGSESIEKMITLGETNNESRVEEFPLPNELVAQDLIIHNNNPLGFGVWVYPPVGKPHRFPHGDSGRVLSGGPVGQYKLVIEDPKYDQFSHEFELKMKKGNPPLRWSMDEHLKEIGFRRGAISLAFQSTNSGISDQAIIVRGLKLNGKDQPNLAGLSLRDLSNSMNNTPWPFGEYQLDLEYKGELNGLSGARRTSIKFTHGSYDGTSIEIIAERDFLMGQLRLSTKKSPVELSELKGAILLALPSTTKDEKVPSFWEAQEIIQKADVSSAPQLPVNAWRIDTKIIKNSIVTGILDGSYRFALYPLPENETGEVKPLLSDPIDLLGGERSEPETWEVDASGERTFFLRIEPTADDGIQFNKIDRLETNDKTRDQLDLNAFISANRLELPVVMKGRNSGVRLKVAYDGEPLRESVENNSLTVSYREVVTLQLSRGSFLDGQVQLLVDIYPGYPQLLKRSGDYFVTVNLGLDERVDFPVNTESSVSEGRDYNRTMYLVDLNRAKGESVGIERGRYRVLIAKKGKEVHEKIIDVRAGKKEIIDLRRADWDARLTQEIIKDLVKEGYTIQDASVGSVGEVDPAFEWNGPDGSQLEELRLFFRENNTTRYFRPNDSGRVVLAGVDARSFLSDPANDCRVVVSYSPVFEDGERMYMGFNAMLTGSDSQWTIIPQAIDLEQEAVQIDINLVKKKKDSTEDNTSAFGSNQTMSFYFRRPEPDSKTILWPTDDGLDRNMGISRTMQQIPIDWDSENLWVMQAEFSEVDWKRITGRSFSPMSRTDAVSFSQWLNMIAHFPEHKNIEVRLPCAVEMLLVHRDSGFDLGDRWEWCADFADMNEEGVALKLNEQEQVYKEGLERSNFFIYTGPSKEAVRLLSYKLGRTIDFGKDFVIGYTDATKQRELSAVSSLAGFRLAIGPKLKEKK